MCYNMSWSKQMKIWGKIIDDNKVVKDTVYTIDGDFSIHSFYDYISDICASLDIPVPVILTKHIKNFILFNHTHFTKDDFVEKFYNEKLAIEIIRS